MLSTLAKRQPALLCVLLFVGGARGQQVAKPTEEPAPLAGCESQEVKGGKEKGAMGRFFPAPVAKVKEAAVKALTALDFNVKEQSEHEIEAHKRRHIGVFIRSGGESVILRFQEAEENGEKGARVIGETKKTLVGRVGQKSWTNAVLDQTRCMLVASGK